MGCWSAPYGQEDAKEVRILMMNPLTPYIAKGRLYGLIGDDTLFDSLEEAIEGGDDDVRPIVLNFLQTWFGKDGDDEDVLEEWGWSDEFDDGALAIFKEMLTDWNQNQRFPTDKASDGSTVMTPRQLAECIREYVEILAGNSPRNAAKLFRTIFPDVPITAKKDGTFHVVSVD